MLNELLKCCFGCPVCGRILYRPLKGYWCPYCGADVETGQPNKIINLKNRLTARDDNGVPYYCGEHTFHSFTYPQDMSISAIEEILEKLCQYEEIEVENDKIIDKLVELGNQEIEVIEDEG